MGYLQLFGEKLTNAGGGGGGGGEQGGQGGGWCGSAQLELTEQIFLWFSYLILLSKQS